MDEIKRGDIFYIARGGAATGSEQYADKPAIVVSGDEYNKRSTIIEVVYLTTQPKADLPTHVTIRSTGRVSTALCGVVSSVPIARINGYIGRITDREMESLNIALAISCGLDLIGDSDQRDSLLQEKQEKIDNLEAEMECIREECAARIAEAERKAPPEDAIRLQAERDLYKELYENLLAKAIRKARS